MNYEITILFFTKSGFENFVTKFSVSNPGELTKKYAEISADYMSNAKYCLNKWRSKGEDNLVLTPSVESSESIPDWLAEECCDVEMLMNEEWEEICS